jgi:UDP-glucose 4-epimerase
VAGVLAMEGARVLVTGGAGYIGTHTVLSLLDAGASVVILDNLCNSSAASLERVKELAGDKASRIAFHQARGGVRGRRLCTRLMPRCPRLRLAGCPGAR